jgi:chemotaxis signal transduction protein
VVDVHERVLQAPPDTLATSSRELLSGVYQLQDVLLLVLDLDRAISAGASTSADTQPSTRSTP